MTDLINRNMKFLQRPYSYICFSLYSMTIKMLVMLCVQIILLLISRSYQAFFVILASSAATVLADLVWYFCTRQRNENVHAVLISIVQGLMCGMLIPQNYPLLAVFLVVFFAMLVSKNFFGGYSFTWINPCIFSAIILWIVGFELFPGFLIPIDSLASRNPSLILIESGAIPVCSFDSLITDFLNENVFSWFKVSVPEGYVSLFWDTKSVIPAFRFNFATLISSIILFCDNFEDMIIPGVFLFVYSFLIRIVSPFFFSGLMFQGDILLAILTGGTFFCAFFILNWMGTVPSTNYGKTVYAFVSAVAMFFIAGCGTSSCGGIFTVLVANICSIIIQQFEDYVERTRLKRHLDEIHAEDLQIQRGLYSHE